MKKLTILFVTLLFLGFGCKTSLSSNTPTKETAQTTVPYSALLNLLATSTITEVSSVPQFALPPTIYPEQVKKYFKLGTYYFALYQKGSAQVFLEPQSIHDASSRSGILFAADGARNWTTFFEIKDTSATPRGTPFYLNNPFYLWNNKTKLFLLVSDDAGAGSGEGTAKLLVSKDAGQTWDINNCFYFDLIGYNDMKNMGQIETLADYVNRYLFSPRAYDSYVIQSYDYNSTTQQFYLEQFNKETQKAEVVVQENCKNLKQNFTW